MQLCKLLFLLLTPFLAFGQNQVQNELLELKSQGSDFTSMELFSPSSKSLSSVNLDSKILDKAALVELNAVSITELMEETPSLFSMDIPTPSGDIFTLELMRHELFAPGFQVIDSETNLPILYEAGLHYKGMVNGDPTSLVAISFYPNEVMGLVNTDEGNLVIARKEVSSSTHIIFNAKDLKKKTPLDCSTPEDDYIYTNKELNFQIDTKDVGDCITVYIEIDNDIVVDKGGSTGATNYITGLFNQSIILYANEQIEMSISEIKVWTTTSPYSSSSSSGMLNAFQANTGAINGDLGHLVSYQASGGIAAGFSGICASNPDDSKCFSSINSTYADVPNYSFSVMVVTHEMGHLIGSRHTHACVWNGNGTAIDGCSGFTEGSCPIPGNPSNGGTIMSYCHVTSAGINFNLGFGTQPGNVVRSTVANANCLAPCGSGPSCSDGIQNQGETGIDCGGPNCAPCNTNCTDVVFNITFDNYPEETSWTIKDAGGTTVASGGTYGSQADGSSLSITNCLADGCYDFTINDTYGDGICCAYGSGSYNITVNGSTVASGGAFTSSETTNFCIGGPVVSCSDGIQNGDETGVDCGGSVCPACPVDYCASTGNNTNYEWIESFNITGINNVSGNDNGYGDYTNLVLSSVAGSTYSVTLVPGFSNSTYTENWKIWVDYNIDGDFDDAGELVLQAAGSGTINGSFTIPANTALGNARMRVSMKWNAYSQPCESFTYGEVEDYTVSLSPSALVGDDYVEPKLFVSEEFDTDNQLTLTPNPANEVLNLKYNLLRQANVDIAVYDVQGQQMIIKKLSTDSERLDHALDISALPDGIYYINMVQEGINITSRFMVMNQ